MLRELHTFIAVTRYGTFSAAGQRVGLTQSAVSAQIRMLEQHLGMLLFDRSGRAAVLNANGQRVLPIAQEIIVLFGRIRQPATVSEYGGTVRIGAISTTQTGLLPQVLLRLQRQAPSLETQLVPGVSFNLLNQVEAGNIDLAVVIKPDFVLTKDLYSEPLLREPFVLVTPPDMQGDDPLALLRDAPFIRYDRTSFGGRMVSQFLRQQRLTPKIALEIDEIDAIVRMVEHNLGVALVPLAGQWRERADRVRVVPLGESLTFYRELIVVMRYSWRQSPLHQLITGFLRAAATEAQTG